MSNILQYRITPISDKRPDVYSVKLTKASWLRVLAINLLVTVGSTVAAGALVNQMEKRELGSIDSDDPNQNV